MRRNKIFRWLYFLILLIPMLFVFLPMINNKDNVFTNTYEIDTKTDLIGSKDFLDFIVENSYLISNDGYTYYRFHLNNEVVKKVILYYVNVGQNISISITEDDGDSLLFGLYLEGLVINSTDNYIRFNNITCYGDYDVVGVGTDTIDFNRDEIDYARNNLSYFFNSFGYNIYNGAYPSYTNFLPYYYETSYELKIINTSIWYDFSVKMNDSFPFIGGFTEFVNDNIIDLSNNDYVFFAFTYMVYIFVVSLLWLIFEFLMFVINFTHKFMGRFYE